MKTNIGRPFIGILLITLGVLYLLTNIGVIPLGLREVLSNYWPAVIILWAGYRLVEGFFLKTTGKHKFNRIYWSLGFIIIGGVLLENRVNYVTTESIGLWSILFSIVIIYAGLSIVFFKSNSMEIRFDGKEAGGKCHKTAKEQPEGFAGAFEEEREEDHPGDEKAGYSKDEIKERIKQKQQAKKEKFQQKNKKDRKNYGYKFDKDRFHFVGEIRLGDQPWALENSSYSLGVGEVYMDLTTALLEEGVTYINLSGWVGSVQIVVPEDLAIDVSADVNIGSVEIFGEEQEFSRHHKNRRSGVSSNLLCYRSEDYDEALKKVRINASVNIGEVSVKKVG